MKKSRIHSIRREQKKSFYLRKIATFIQKISHDEPTIAQVFITRVDLSADGSICYLFCSASDKSDAFKKALETLKLYKPSIRKALASTMSSRYVPDLVFLYDEVKEKVQRVEELLDQIDQEDTH